jgi:Flp pilus assembly secretin CpaC
MIAMRRTAALAFAVAAGLTTSQALAGGVAVPLDEVRTVAFAKPVATVYVGNPSIADINMIDARHAFVLGKRFGTTNIIALDNSGHEHANTYVSVSGSNGAIVTLTKGATPTKPVTQTTLSCTGVRCEESPVPGDARFGEVMGESAVHDQMGTKAH